MVGSPRDNGASIPRLNAPFKPRFVEAQADLCRPGWPAIEGNHDLVEAQRQRLTKGRVQWWVHRDSI
jgi:hypothetical protein